MVEAKEYFPDLEKAKEKFNTVPENEELIKQLMTVNNGIAETFTVFLATMW